MREIQLTQGKVAFVDDEDFNELMKYKWYTLKHRNTFYAARGIINNGKWKVQLMHRLIMGDNLEKPMIDHKDGDGWNNQRYNLRPCTNQENQMNRRPNRSCSSEYIGVCWDKPKQKWMARIRINGDRKHLGFFSIEEDAAKAWDNASLERNSGFNRLNFPNK